MAHTLDMYRTSLRIQHEGIDETFWSSGIYGRRLSLLYNGSNQPQLVLDGDNTHPYKQQSLHNLIDLYEACNSRKQTNQNLTHLSVPFLTHVSFHDPARQP
jgi:hypothetical protein